jgi:hypothetical protein
MSAQHAKKTVKKSGRTLLVTVAESSLPLEHTTTLTGLVNKVVTKTGKSMFLMFDTIENAVSGFRKLRTLGIRQLQSWIQLSTDLHLLD